VNAGELREALEKVRDDTLIVLSRDAEGNSYSPLDEPTSGFYVPENRHSGELWTGEDGEREPPDDAVSAVFLWPVN
jgi:hypothetical protein